nr:hypothetical protein CFP56_56549 [Quercus suber]
MRQAGWYSTMVNVHRTRQDPSIRPLPPSAFHSLWQSMLLYSSYTLSPWTRENEQRAQVCVPPRDLQKRLSTEPRHHRCCPALDTQTVGACRRPNEHEPRCDHRWAYSEEHADSQAATLVPFVSNAVAGGDTPGRAALRAAATPAPTTLDAQAIARVQEEEPRGSVVTPAPTSLDVPTTVDAQVEHRQGL